tara:strand:- start:53518 stop:54417 length:900 start_codon:yes stop_codon:yes gene_type:complete
MKKIYNISIILSFVGLWITSHLSGTTEIILGFSLIFSFGILHGSNDILLINRISKRKQNRKVIKILSIYILTVFSAVLVFYYIPQIALFLFILFSSFHFGEQHWENKNLNINKYVNTILYFIYGMLVLQTLFVFNSEEVVEILYSISNHTIKNSLINYSFISTVICYLLLNLFITIKYEALNTVFLTEIFYLIIFSIIFKVSTLIWGFTIYFIFWHSIPSLFQQVSFIYKDFNKKTVLKYCLNAFPYWIISLLGISLVFYFYKDDKMFYGIFFSFIAAVTFPHTLVINKMFLHKKTQPN